MQIEDVQHGLSAASHNRNILLHWFLFYTCSQHTIKRRLLKRVSYEREFEFEKKYYTLNHLNKSIQRIESDKSNIHVKHYWMFNFHPSWVKMLSSNVEKWPWNQNTLVLMDKKIKYSTVDLQFAFIRQGKKIISSAVVLEDASFFINSLCSITCVYFLTAP